MDKFDHTDQVEEHIKNLNIQAIRNSSRELNPIGECHWCGEPLEKDSQRLFCPGDYGPSDCALDWEKDKKMRGAV